MFSCCVTCGPSSWPRCQSIESDWAHHISTSSFLSALRTTPLGQPVLYIWDAVPKCRAGSRWPTPCLGFQSVPETLDGYEWVVGNNTTCQGDRSTKRVNWVIPSEAGSLRWPEKCHRFPLVFSYFFFPFLFCFLQSSESSQYLKSAHLMFVPIPCFPLFLSCPFFLLLVLFSS